MDRPETRIYIAATVDGFIARPDDRIDWLEHDSGGEDYGWEEFRGLLDAIVLGRRTYEQVLGFGVEWPYEGLAAVVWSRTLGAAAVPAALRDEGVEVSALEPSALLADLGERGIRRVWIDGGQTLQAFLAAGLVDVLSVTRIPVLIGEGIPLFGALPQDVHLEHLETRSFGSGVVRSDYAVRGASSRATR